MKEGGKGLLQQKFVVIFLISSSTDQEWSLHTAPNSFHNHPVISHSTSFEFYKWISIYLKTEARTVVEVMFQMYI
jgi:hypothetical protein